MSHRLLLAGSVPIALLAVASPSAFAQSAGAIYSWDAPSNTQSWVRNFGTNTATLDNNIPGSLTIAETGSPGTTMAISDGANRVRESSANAGGGTDLTGLSFLEFDLGHNGTGDIPVQFFIQGSTGFNYVGLGPDLMVSPGVHTYQVPLAGLTADQKVYVRTMGFNARDHVAQGNVTWTLNEVRSVGQTLTQRTLVNFDNGSAENGLQGAIVNFDNASVVGNNAGQNQTGLTHNATGTGSLEWIDAAGGAGGAISWGNGTAWNGNTFNNRTTDLSNYTTATVRISATPTTAALGGTELFDLFFQVNNFSLFQTAGTRLSFPIDGQFHDVTFPLDTLTSMNVIDTIGVNLGSHTDELRINIDSVVFSVPEPASTSLLSAIALSPLARRRRPH